VFSGDGDVVPFLFQIAYNSLVMRIQELGHVVLYVTNLGRSVSFYRDVLGFPEVGRMQLSEGGAVAFSSGRTHHELLLIEVGGEPNKSQTIQPGLYHIGFKIGDSPNDLKQVYQELKTKGVPIVGASDHAVTHSLYILDPDGNEIELYADVSDAWKGNPALVLAPIKPLKLE
jgi:catechol 2,3-dioxygenase